AMMASAYSTAMAAGTANPTPSLAPDSVKIETLIPMTSPSRLISAPPELPGLMAASVCTIATQAWPVDPQLVWSTAETMPWVTVEARPQGLPTAIAICPTRGLEVSNFAGGRPEGSAWMTAMSTSGALPRTW